MRNIGIIPLALSLSVAVLILLFLIFIPFVSLAVFGRALNTKSVLLNNHEAGIVLTDRNNKPFFTFYKSGISQTVPLDKVSSDFKHAVVAIEDKEFYKHRGVSIRGIGRSIWKNITAGAMVSGGSTITQQVVKITLLNPKKILFRKFLESFLAQELEKRYSKDEILEIYVNTVYFGEGAIGIEQAAHTYFGKSAADLNLAESSLLAGMLVAPSDLSPLGGNLALAKERQTLVLHKMAEQSYIDEEQIVKASNERLNFHSNEDSLNVLAPHFALMVRDQLIEMYGEEQLARSGARVRTTLDSEWQQFTEKIVADQVNALAKNHVTNGAAVILDVPTAEVRALVGSKDWYDEKNGKVNMTVSPRQPGSSFKPIVYALAFEKQLITPSTILTDKPTSFGGNYKPVNYDKRFRGNVLPRRALSNSLNVPSVEVMTRIGVEPVLDFAKQLGFTTLGKPSDYGFSLVLGSGEVPLLEMTNAYSIFARGGLRKQTKLILSVEDKFGTLVYTPNDETNRIVSEGAAFLITSMLSDAKSRSEVFGNVLNTSVNAAVKTGTSENYRDSLTVGYTSNLAVGAWVGNNDDSPMNQVAGSLGANPIFKSLIERFSLQERPKAFVPPSGVIEKLICSSNGLLANQATSSARKEYFLEGTEPTKPCFSGKTEVAHAESENTSQSPNLDSHTLPPEDLSPESDPPHEDVENSQKEKRDDKDTPKE